MKKEILGYTKENQEIIAYTLKGKGGLTARVMNYGCNLLNLWVLDKTGNCRDVVLGYEHIEDYLENEPGFGCCITPCCNRIGGASYTLNGVRYFCDKNDGENNLHSGFYPMHHRIWDVAAYQEESITFLAHKTDGDMGFPGELDIRITYTIGADNSIQLEYWGISDRDTVFNPTNHSYFNLAGAGSGSVLDEIAWLDGDYVTEAGEDAVPTGKLLPVKGTSLDFTVAKPLSEGIADYGKRPIRTGEGINHNYVLKKRDISRSVAKLYEPGNGLTMEVYTDMPGIQLYTANYLSAGDIGKGGISYGQFAGVCFESQFFPNAINIPAFEQPVLKAGRVGRSVTIYKFTVA